MSLISPILTKNYLIFTNNEYVHLRQIPNYFMINNKEDLTI